MADIENDEREERLWEAKKAEYKRVRNLEADNAALRAENERLIRERDEALAREKEAQRLLEEYDFLTEAAIMLSDA